MKHQLIRLVGSLVMVVVAASAGPPSREPSAPHPAQHPPAGQFRQPDRLDMPDDLAPGDRNDRRRHRLPAKLTPQQHQALMGFLAEHFPDMHDRLSHQPKTAPAARGRMFGQLWHLYQTYQRHPNLGRVLIADQKLEFRIRRHARSHAAATAPDARDQLRQDLRRMLAEQFDLRLQRRRLELQELQARLEDQKQRLERLEQSRQDVIHRRLERLTSPDAGPPRHGPRRRHRPPQPADLP